MFNDHGERGVFASHVRERRFFVQDRVGMIETEQPPGTYIYPATGCLIVAEALSPFRGCIDVGFGSRATIGRVGDVSIQLPQQEASITQDVTTAFRIAAIDTRLLDGIIGDQNWREPLRRPGLESRPDPETGALLSRMWEAASGRDPAGRLLMEGAALVLVGHLLRSLEKRTEPRHRCGGLAPWQIRRTTDYMIDHMDRDIGLAELGALIGLSGSHFCTAFRQSTGLPPHAWLTRARIDRAKELLADPRLSLTEVAQAIGYSGQTTFGDAFRRATGLTPGRWRRMMG
ncbi:MAG: hypothetical protein RLY86_1881 [Pseudomonadota bacterium]|jgi:AraC-like DNA-binding protein